MNLSKMTRLTPKCFLDMDGVLADFVTGMCFLHKRDNPYELPDNFGKFNLDGPAGILNISTHDFWSPTDKDFWKNLPKTLESDNIVRLAIEHFGVENVAICTAPTYEAEGCIEGKKFWIHEHYPVLNKQVVYTKAKHFLAGSARVLVDDYDENITKFSLAGGDCILVPRFWNSEWNQAHNTLNVIKRKFTDLKTWYDHSL